MCTCGVQWSNPIIPLVLKRRNRPAYVSFFSEATYPRSEQEVRIYDSPHVTEAPAATSTGSFQDARGSYDQRVYGDGENGTSVNVVFTRKGHLRSGDLHACEQVNHLVWGR